MKIEAKGHVFFKFNYKNRIKLNSISDLAFYIAKIDRFFLELEKLIACKNGLCSVQLRTCHSNFQIINFDLQENSNENVGFFPLVVLSLIMIRFPPDRSIRRELIY